MLLRASLVLRWAALDLLVEAAGADSIGSSLDQGGSDVLLPPPDRFQVEPLFANLESPAPGATDDAHLTRASSTQFHGQINDALRIEDEPL
jgi:hypothetical protein